MGNGQQLFGGRWVSNTTLPVKLRIIPEKDRVLADSPLANTLASLVAEFKIRFDKAEKTGAPGYSEEVKLLWQVALADKKQGELCPDAVKGILEHVVLHESELDKIGFYSELLHAPPPSEASRSMEQQLIFFLFLVDTEINRKPRQPFSTMAALDCSEFIQNKLYPTAPANQKIN